MAKYPTTPNNPEGEFSEAQAMPDHPSSPEKPHWQQVLANTKQFTVQSGLDYAPEYLGFNKAYYNTFEQLSVNGYGPAYAPKQPLLITFSDSNATLKMTLDGKVWDQTNTYDAAGIAAAKTLSVIQKHYADQLEQLIQSEASKQAKELYYKNNTPYKLTY